jgi:hypothetical protein
MKKNLKRTASLLVGTCLLTLVSCGNDDNKNSNTPAKLEEQQQEDIGIYRAILAPMNAGVAGNTVGTIEITITGDDVVVTSNVSGAPNGVKHLQNVMLSTSCPEAAADANQDTFIDIIEGVPSTGPILIPLDSNLSEQIGGMSYGPIANRAGKYFYRRSTSLTALLADLRAPDADATDALAKLPPGQELNLAGRVVLIHGVPTSAALPDTVATVGDLPAEQTLPIACGVLVRVPDDGTTTGTTTGGDTGTTTGDTGTTTGGTGTTTGETGTTTGGFI